MMKIAIVTGASSGIGREYVKQISEKYELDEIWAIARREDRLLELKSITKTPVIPITLDLTDKSYDEKLKRILAEINPDVRVLVNAAGCGRIGAFEDLSVDDHDTMLELNINALTKITSRVLPYMSRGSEIFFMASRSGFHPVPYLSTYAATKAYVLSLSRAMNVELKSRGIRTVAVSPGWVRTEFIDRATVQDGVITYYNSFVTAEQVVKKSFCDMKKGKDVSICGASTRFQVFLAKLISHRLVMWIWCKQQNK
jgi:short-subunit dehydrogenase